MKTSAPICVRADVVKMEVLGEKSDEQKRREIITAHSAWLQSEHLSGSHSYSPECSSFYLFSLEIYFST